MQKLIVSKTNLSTIAGLVNNVLAKDNPFWGHAFIKGTYNRKSSKRPRLVLPEGGVYSNIGVQLKTNKAGIDEWFSDDIAVFTEYESETSSKYILSVSEGDTIMIDRTTIYHITKGVSGKKRTATTILQSNSFQQEAKKQSREIPSRFAGRVKQFMAGTGDW